MLLSEDPATLIHHTINNFNINPDKLAVSRIDESLSTLQQARDLRMREAESSLKKLARQLSTLASRHEELVASHRAGHNNNNSNNNNSSGTGTGTGTDHPSSVIARLDTHKFRTAKAASDAEAEAERVALQAADLAARLQELELQGTTGGGGGGGGAGGGRDAVDDEVLLRLKVYRSLGIDIERDDQDGGAWVRAVIRNDRKGDVHVVNMEKKFSRFFYANYFWKTL